MTVNQKQRSNDLGSVSKGHRIVIVITCSSTMKDHTNGAAQDPLAKACIVKTILIIISFLCIVGDEGPDVFISNLSTSELADRLAKMNRHLRVRLTMIGPLAL